MNEFRIELDGEKNEFHVLMYSGDFCIEDVVVPGAMATGLAYILEIDISDYNEDDEEKEVEEEEDEG